MTRATSARPRTICAASRVRHSDSRTREGSSGARAARESELMSVPVFPLCCDSEVRLRVRTTGPLLLPLRKPGRPADQPCDVREGRRYRRARLFLDYAAGDTRAG